MKIFKKSLPIIILSLVAIIFSACGAAAYDNEAYSKDSGVSVEYAAPAEAPMMEMEAASGYEDDSLAVSDYNGDAQQVERMIIKNANMRIATEDPNQILNEIMLLSDELDGYVVSSSVYQSEYDTGIYINANISIRVPAEDLDMALTRIEEKATQVLSMSVSGEDVTAEYVDLSSRLTNLESAEAELSRIMQDAQNTEDVLNVYDELTYYREQIEVTKGRMKYLQESAAMSSISVDIVSDQAVQPLTVGNWEPSGIAKDAIQALLNAVKFFVNAAIWIVLFILPVLIILAIPVVAAYFIIRAIVRRTKKNKMAKENPEQE